MKHEKHYDLLVIGSGPGGYVAAIKGAQLGLTVGLIERKELGGTCLNVGCIPTKALTANAQVYRTIQRAEEYGISLENLSFDFSKMADRKTRVVSGIRQSLEQLIKKNQIEILQGTGSFHSPHEIKVQGKDQGLYTADKIIIAVGAEPRSLPGISFDGKIIHSSTSLLDLQHLPKSLVIIGGGVIGCEAASLYHALGVDITIVEMLPHLISVEGEEIASVLRKAFEKEGITIYTEARVTELTKSDTAKVSITLEGGKQIDASAALVSVGRRLNTDTLDLARAGVAMNDQGAIPVNDHQQTNIPHIYAIGDVTGQWWLAHMASHQGIIAAENVAHIPSRLSTLAVPSVIFTYPEIATVGLTLEKAQQQGWDARVGRFPFQFLGKAQATIKTEGFAQVVIDRPSGRILGAQIVGHEASSLIAEMGLAIANELTIECIIETIHAHPTLAEAWLEASLVANETPIHLPPKKVEKRNG